MKRIMVLLILFLLCCVRVEAQSVKDQAQLNFIKAGAAYQAADYVSAIEQYESVLESGVLSAPLYYNLGNAYFKAKQLGKAILYYERAARLQPRDPDVEANLRLARSLVERYGEEEQKSFWKTWMPHMDMVSFDEITSIVLGLFFILGGVVLFGITRRWRLSRLVMWSGFVGIVLLFHVTVLSVKADSLSGQAVVLSEVKAKFEPIDDATDHFQLGEGMVVKLIKSQYGWSKIQRMDGRIGWIPQEALNAI